MSPLKMIFCSSHFSTKENDFLLKRKPLADQTNSKNFTLLGTKITSYLTINCKYVFFIFSKNTHRRNASESFFGRYQQAACDKTNSPSI